MVMVAFLLISYVTYISLGIGDIRQNLAIALSLVLAILFYFVCVNFMAGFYNRGSILNLDEKVCASTFLMVVSMGLTELGVNGFSFLKLVFNLTPQQEQRDMYHSFFTNLPQSGQYPDSIFGAIWLCEQFLLILNKLIIHI